MLFLSEGGKLVKNLGARQETTTNSMFLFTVESRFIEPPRKTKIGSKNRRVREIDDRQGRGTSLWLELSRES